MTRQHWRTFFFITTGIFSFSLLRAQQFSIATDVSALHNFSSKERFWTVGQTLQANFHFDTKETFYTWLNYYKPGRFSSSYTAEEKNAPTVPATYSFTMNSQWRFRQLSLGWKHYFFGGYNNYTGWNLYGLAGFGLSFNKVQNTYLTHFDTAYYVIHAPQEGSGNARRLSLDLGAGTEYPIGGYTFLYADVRSWVPASSTTSPYVYGAEKVPFPFIICLGVRILFGQ